MPESSLPELLAYLRAHSPSLRDSAPEADRLCRLPDDTSRILVRGGLFRSWIPRRFGGAQLALPDALRLYEAAARIDGSIGWAVMIGAGGGLFAATLPPAGAAAIFSPPDAVIAGSGTPSGRAERVPGGWRCSGRWRYASGADYATTFTAQCALVGEPALEATPIAMRAMAFERAQVVVQRTWDPLGMRGTGSHDFEVVNAFVPDERSFDVFGAPHDSGPLYRLPFDVLTVLPITAVALGIASHALDGFAAATRRRRLPHGAGSPADDATVQARFAIADATVGSVRAHIHALAKSASECIAGGGALTAAELAAITAACVRGAATLGEQVAALVAVAGMGAVTGTGELGRAWRDLQTLSAHASIAPTRLAPAGRTLLHATE